MQTRNTTCEGEKEEEEEQNAERENWRVISGPRLPEKEINLESGLMKRGDVAGGKARHSATHPGET